MKHSYCFLFPMKTLGGGGEIGLFEMTSDRCTMSVRFVSDLIPSCSDVMHNDNDYEIMRSMRPQFLVPNAAVALQ